MGFITPGRAHKRKKAGSFKKPVEIQVKRTKLRESVELKEVSNEKSLSLLEKLPLEILHEVFVYSGDSSLHFLNKRLNQCLKPSLYLIVKMLKLNHLYDLNSEITKKQLETGEVVEINNDQIRYALDKEAFKYNCISLEVLKELNFDIVLPINSIELEMKNRLILYHDELNKKLLNSMRNDEEVSSEEINRELARMAEERFSTSNDNSNENNENNEDINIEEDLNELSEDSQDFHKRFYEMKNINNEFLQIIEYLFNFKKITYVEGDKAIINVLESSSCNVSTLDKILSLTKTGKIMTVEPLIKCFTLNLENYIEIGDWIIDNLNDETLINDTKLWEFVAKTRNFNLLNFLISKGSTPSYQSLILTNMR